MKRNLLLKGVCILLSAFVYSSCISEMEEVISDYVSSEIKKITVTLPESNFEGNSRMSIQVGNSVNYIWEGTDTIGIFPNQGYQVAFPLNTSSNSSSAIFEGGGWGLLANSTYAAYYPFNYNHQRSDSIPVTYLEQKQVGNANADYIDKYNYMFATGSKPADGSLNFSMQRLGRFIVLKFNVSEISTLSSVKLIAARDIFVTKGYFSLWADTPSIIPTETSNTLTIALAGIVPTTENEEVTIYFFMAPVDFSDQNLTVEATNIKGNRMYSTVKGLDIREKKAYKLISSSLQEVNVTVAGTLSTHFDNGNEYHTAALKITGNLNGTDIKFIRQMAGKNYDGSSTEGILSMLDLSEASMVEGGENYYTSGVYTYGTEVNKISAYMFAELTTLQTVLLPTTITTIEKSAFRDCSNLRRVNISKGVTSIGSSAFKGCKNLENISIPSGVTNIGEYAFKDCEELVRIELPQSVRSIGNWVFGNCRNFTEINFLNGGIKEIGSHAFSGCGNLITIKGTQNLTTIGEYAFYYCTSLTYIDLTKVTSIGKYAFYCCRNLERIYMPYGLKAIEEYTFNDCLKLANINIPSSVTTIGKSAFEHCIRIEGITIPKNITSIGNKAFRHSGITEVISLAQQPPTLGTDCFDNSTYILYVPKGYATYYNGTDWDTHFIIIEMEE